MKRLLPLIAALSVSAASAQAFPLTVRHDLGSTTLTRVPQRVVVIQEETAELLAVLGVRPVGFGSTRVQGATPGRPLTALTAPAARSLGQPVFVGTHDQPSLETIAALRPDLILMSAGDDGSNTLYPQLARLAPTLAFDYDAGASGWRRALTEVGRVLGKSAQARRYLATYDARVATLKAQIAPVTAAGPNTALLYMFDPQSVVALGEKFSFSRTLGSLGLKLVVPAGMTPDLVFKVLSPEALTTLKADRTVLLRLKVNGQPLPRNATDALLARAGVPVVTYLLDPQEPSSGPITDLRRIEALARLLR
ncbi:ABC transporter substrate-binding protein [Deinococcus sp. YIM 134068]|uniref:ABC transporter substrate-binding protein n=1 Tax=Deinococcus lichenicola TaxID=3118910 RepID=UPI002F91C233